MVRYYIDQMFQASRHMVLLNTVTNNTFATLLYITGNNYFHHIAIQSSFMAK